MPRPKKTTSTVSYRCEEHKAKISQGRVEAWRLFYETIGRELPESKRCNACGEIKKVDPDPSISEFTIRQKPPNKTGIPFFSPVSECKSCAAERAARVRARKSFAERQALRKKYDARRDKEKVRRYNRQYGRLRRDQEGIPVRGPWAKYAHELESRDTLVPSEPLRAFLADNWPYSFMELERLTGVSEAIFRRTGKLYSSTVDRVLTRMGYPDQFIVLYGDYLNEKAA